MYNFDITDITWEYIKDIHEPDHVWYSLQYLIFLKKSWIIIFNLWYVEYNKFIRGNTMIISINEGAVLMYYTLKHKLYLYNKKSWTIIFNNMVIKW